METKNKKYVWSWLIIASLFFSPWLNAAEENNIDPKAKEVLNQASNYLDDIQSFQLDMDIEMNIEALGNQNNISSEISVAIQRPNKVAIRSQGGLGGNTLVTDGSHLYRSIDPLNIYVEKEKPASLNELSTFPFENIPEEAKRSPQVMFTDFLLKDNSIQNFLDNVEAVTYMDRETVDDVECHRIQFKSEEIDWILYIQAGDHPLVRKIIPDMEKAMAKTRQQVPNMPDMKVEMSLDYKKWDTNPTFTDATFAYEPPEGFKKVDDLQEAIQQQTSQSINPPNGEETSHPMVGKSAPTFTLDKLDNSTFNLEDHLGEKVIILDFWATWCGPCRQAMPILESVADEFKDQDVILTAINVRETPDEIQAFLNEENLNVEVALDRNGEVGNQYQVRGIPQTVIIGKEGTVQAVHVGFLPSLRSQLQEELKQLVEGKDLNEARNKVANRSTISETKSLMKSMDTALEMFYIDNDEYPTPPEGERTVDRAFLEKNGKTLFLNKPITYLSSIPKDPFNPDDQSFRYHTDGENWFILVSNGPDGDIDFDERSYEGETLSELTDYIYTPAKGTGDIIQINR